jgi:hypothetical protein
MKDNTAKLESLKKQEESLSQKISTVSDQISKLVELKWLPWYTERYVDTYWVKKNGYGKKDLWPLYTHVKAIKGVWEGGKDGVNCLVVRDSFQCTTCGEIDISFGETEFLNTLGKQITKSVYEKAKQALLDKLRSQL